MTKTNENVKRIDNKNKNCKEGETVDRFTEFKKHLGCTAEEIAKVTGYTRQGLYNAFNLIHQGKEPSKKLSHCINAAVDKKIQEEEARHEARVQELKSLYIGNADNVISFQRKAE